MLTTEVNGNPIVWNGHLCEGDQMAPFDRGTFILWTRCGKHDVPGGKAYTGPQVLLDVQCADCLATVESNP